MRVLHFSSSIFPFMRGGTEIFIENIINAQRNIHEITNLLWAAHDEKNLINFKTTLEKDNKTIIKSLPPLNRIETFSGICHSIKDFEELLENYSPDIVHLHNFNSNCGLTHAKIIKKYNIKLIISIHTTPCSCLGNNIFYENPKLDGLFHDQCCTAIRLKHKGLPAPLANIISFQNGFPINVESKNKFAKLLTSRQLTNKLHRNYFEYLKLANKIHVCSKWVEDLIYKQGFCKNKVTFIRAGIEKETFRHTRKLMEDGVLKLIYFGRCEEKKGIHIIIKAIKRLKNDFPIQLDIFTQTWESEYCSNISKLINKDKKFKIFINHEKGEILHKLNEYDLVVIPSIWLETGPLVALEALSSRIPIAGTNQGGIKEILEDIDNCFLVKPKIKSWMNLFSQLLLREGDENEIKHIPYQNFLDVSKEMIEKLYKSEN